MSRLCRLPLMMSVSEGIENTSAAPAGPLQDTLAVPFAAPAPRSKCAL